jgi:translation initiation factor 2 alpha subunit (eIF-2alpha)
MSEQKLKWPEPGDLVMATIKTVMDSDVFANLDEYNKRGFSSYLRNLQRPHKKHP